MKLALRAGLLRSTGDVHGRRVARPTRFLRVYAARRVAVVAAAGTKLQDGLLQAGGWSLQEEGTVYGEGFLVRSCEVAADRRATLPALLRLLQECATNHALRVGLCSDDGYCVDETMAEQNLIWVLTKMRLRVPHAYPTWGDTLEIRTWFESSGKTQARRDWEIVDGSTGQKLLGATSVWVLVNTKTRRLARFPAHMIEAYSSKSPSYSKWGLDEGATCEKIPTVEPVEVSLAGLRAHWSDIDMNNHINNVTYLEWVMDVIPQHLWKESQLREVDIEWCAEGDVDIPVDSEMMLDSEYNAPMQERYIHRLQQAGKTLFKARTRWESNS